MLLPETAQFDSRKTSLPKAISKSYRLWTGTSLGTEEYAGLALRAGGGLYASLNRTEAACAGRRNRYFERQRASLIRDGVLLSVG